MSRLPIRVRALERIDLLQDVVEFKMRFYRCPWARYEEARPGSLRLLPTAQHFVELQRDYQSMQSMLFGYIPSFEEIVTELTDLERNINTLRTGA